MPFETLDNDLFLNLFQTDSFIRQLEVADMREFACLTCDGRSSA
jgi:hypothetical protein